MFSKLSLRASLLSVGLLVVSCATDIKKSDVSSSTNPQEAMNKLENDLNNARTENIDVLAASDYNKSWKMLKEAKEDLADKKDQQTILNNLGYSKAYLERATATANSRRGQVAPLLDARQAAIKAGAGKYSQLKKELADADENIISESSELGKLKTDEIAEMIGEYVALEKNATILTELGSAQAKINGAVKDSGEKKAPQTLKKAQLDLKNAETIIATNVRNAAGYKASVAQANKSADHLSEVMETINKNGKNLPEATALTLVAQNKKILGLKKDLNTTKAEVAGVVSELESKETELKSKESQIAYVNEELASAQGTVQIQAAIEKARKEFSPDEAEAYQQGDKLLIRLKKINFPVGRAELPETALPILAKVSAVAKSLDATEVTVEGHTDSTGAEKLNLDLSKKRAESVATYFKSNGLGAAEIESEGYGFSRPIADNKSSAGRAQNRRVDIIIEPMASSKKADDKSVE